MAEAAAAERQAREKQERIEALALAIEREQRAERARARRLDPLQQAAVKLEEQTRGMDFIRKAKGPDGRPALLDSKVKPEWANVRVRARVRQKSNL